MSYLFIIKTDSYAGNFEREMSGYCSGSVSDDDENHGEDLAIKFHRQFPEEAERIDDIIEGKGENPTMYCGIWQNEDKQYNNVAIYFGEIPDDDLLDLMKQRAIEYSENRKDCCDRPDTFKVLGFSLIKETTTTIYEEL